MPLAKVLLKQWQFNCLEMEKWVSRSDSSVHFCSKSVFDRFVIKTVRRARTKKKVEKQSKVPVQDGRKAELQSELKC